MPFNLFQTVRLTTDIPADESIDPPEPALSAGTTGTVVDLLDGTAYLVEFADDQGRTIALPALTEDQITRA
ncbi:hypothetical protein CMUST_12390 [Corynebacterium mustelae]|uniref:DUF4926 domain-containing protein n=1 Tax=Corynebacterium mustelae TaxID=571915 RepID=A0A0G3H047_9CORY|nr:DUF4926 domain-containing protein [Corynebacterium mustelae]AKK06784.1 hypothetical protein CMUST_12390 [Corynebacterium mustelae]